MFFLCVIIVCILCMICAIIALNVDIYKYLFKHFVNKIKHGHLIIYDAYTGAPIFEIFRSNEYIGKLYTNSFETLCEQVVKYSDIGLGELYMKGEWWSPDLLSLFLLFNKNDKYIQKKRFVPNIRRNTKQDVHHHYDVGNDFYMHFLRDDLHAYTCGFFLCASDDLNTAQYNKVNTIMKKLESEPGQAILDVGCGWGAIANYIGKQTSTNVDGVTLSDEQEKYIIQNYPHIKVFNINFLELSIEKNYDKIYSIGMFEQVQCPDYSKFFAKAYELLKPGGRIVLHTITYSSFNLSICKHQNESFITKHIFPGGQIPTREWIMNAAETNDLKLVHMEVYGGQHYAKTLKIWRENMMERRKEINSIGYSDEFLRKYEFYMAICESSFLSDKMNITHFVFDKVNDLQNVVNNFQCI